MEINNIKVEILSACESAKYLGQTITFQQKETAEVKKRRRSRGCGLGAGPGEGFESVSLPVVCAWATHFRIPRMILRVLCGYFEHQRCVQFEGCAAEPLQTITAILPGSKWSCLLLRIVLQDALSEVTKIYHHGLGETKD